MLNESGYDKHITPPRLNNTKLNKYVDSVKLEIHTTMKIHMLQHFDAVAHGFDAEFTLDLEWFDSRLKYRNLKSKPNINGLSSEEVSTIWFPNFVFVNTAKKDMGLVDEKSVFHVLKKGEGKRYEKYVLENKIIYAGEENYLEYQRHYFKHFECHYELHWYPFDTQECFIEIAPFGDLQKFVELVTEDFIYEGAMELTQFVIKRKGKISNTI